MAVQKIFTATITGIDASLISVEADVSNGLPTTIIVGLPDAAVQESRERVRLAIKHSGFQYPQTRVSLNLAPGYMPKAGTHFDVPIAIAILAAVGLKIPNLRKLFFLGELSFDGVIKPVSGALAMVEAARNAGFSSVFVPMENCPMASLVKGINIYPVENLKLLIEHLSGIKSIHCYKSVSGFISKKQIPEVDLADVMGQDYAKRALEISAAGGHNILMTGPPGSGKTMLAKALGGILPDLKHEETLQLTKIYNSAGRLRTGIINTRPVRSPHHTTSCAALVGGGSIPRPGEVTLAHQGVLFLDELPEFSRSAIEVLRQPLEENKVTITRLRQAYKFPASFILVAAQNPCPCGNFGEPDLECKCPVLSVQRYQKKISGPMLDRIDLHIYVPRLAYRELELKPGVETSEEVRVRVTQARGIQAARFGYTKTNNQMTIDDLKKLCPLTVECSFLLEQASEKYKLSGRSIHRVIKVARTIADLSLSEEIEPNHIAESLQYRLRDSSRA